MADFVDGSHAGTEYQGKGSRPDQEDGDLAWYGPLPTGKKVMYT